MKRFRILASVLILAAGAALLSACASNQPYTAPQAQPQYRVPRSPVVAPSVGPSPWWWPMPDTWWPWQY
jgi:type IV pilus biogenesis protein CpaD/CtpE